MTKLPKPTAIVAGRITDGLTRPVPGARPSICSECREAVWIAPSSDAIAPGAKIICLDCFEKKGLGDNDNMANPTPEQIAEINNALGFEAIKPQPEKENPDARA